MTSTIEPPTEPEPPAGEAIGANKWRTLISVSLGIMMVALDGTVVSVANPTIGRALNASLADLQWVTNGYLLSIAVLLVFGGRLGDRFGRKRLFMIGMAWSRSSRSERPRTFGSGSAWTRRECCSCRARCSRSPGG
jgi:MFS family permease